VQSEFMADEFIQPRPPERAFDSQAEPWELTYCTIMHLSLLVYLIVPIPIVPVLIMWLIKKDQSPLVDDHGREALNFQITLVIYMILSTVLIFCGIGIVLTIGVYVLGLIGMIMAATAANRGEYFRYPMTLRMIH